MNRSSFVAAVFSLMMMGGNAHAAFVYSNFNTGDSYYAGYTYGFLPGTYFGMQFTATADGTLTQVTMPLSIAGGYADLAVELFADNAGAVGSSLATGAVTISGSSSTLYTVAMSSASIVSGDQYWLILKAMNGPTSSTWYISNDTEYGTSVFKSKTGTKYRYDDYALLAAFSVEAAPTNPVPEPSSFLMFGLGGLALGVRSLRRVKQAIV